MACLSFLLHLSSSSFSPFDVTTPLRLILSFYASPLYSFLFYLAGSGGRNTLSLYSGYAPVVGPHNPGFFNHFGATAAAGSSSHTHSLLTQGNLANNNNNGNHTSTSISESQSAATKCVTVGGKRRNTSASDGHQSASSSKGMEPGSISSSMLLQGNDAHLASLSQAQGLGLGPGQGSSQGGQASSSSTHGPSSLTYTGLDGKIGVDKIEHTEGRNGQGQCAHPAPQKDRETLGKTLSRTPHQRNAQAPTSTETSEKTEKEFEQFPAKRARTTSTSRDWTEGNTSKDKWDQSVESVSLVGQAQFSCAYRA